VPLILGTTFLSAHYFAKGCSFAAGAGFFGQSWIMKFVDYLNTNFPGWEKGLQLQK
jgi:hypothetical protein